MMRSASNTPLKITSLKKTPAEGPSGSELDRKIRLSELSDSELVSRIESLDAEERVAMLSVLLHLIEMDRRRLYLSMGYSSLFDFCIRRLRYSESAAARRIRSARCIRDYPEVYDMLSRRELNLVTLSKISGILTPDNRSDILSEAAGKCARDVDCIVSRYRPRRAVRDRVSSVFVMREIPGGDGPCVEGSFGERACSEGFCGNGPCVESSLGDGPCSEGFCGNGPCVESSLGEGACIGGSCSFGPGARASSADTCGNIESRCESRECFDREGDKKFTATGGSKKVDTFSDSAGMFGICERSRGSNGNRDLPRVALEQRFKLEFAVNPEFMVKLERVRELLSMRSPGRLEFEKVFGILMDEYIEHHSPEARAKRRRAREERAARASLLDEAEKQRLECPPETNKSTVRIEHVARASRKGGAVHQSGVGCRIQPKNLKNKKLSQHKKPSQKKPVNKDHRAPVERSRFIPLSVRDEVFTRDGHRCTYVSPDGVRCSSRLNLEIDHIVPYSRGGDNSAGNLRLLCAEHNRLEAERVYGREFMKRFYRRE